MQFDFAATYYDALAKLVFGNLLKEAKFLFLNGIIDGSKVLIIGGGTGASLDYLLSHKRALQIDYVESSFNMIEVAKQRVDGDRAVNFIHKPFEDFTGDGYDYIITEFFFDLFESDVISGHLLHISKCLKISGKWINTDFKNVRILRYRLLLKLMYLFFYLVANVKARSLQNLENYSQMDYFTIEEEIYLKDGFISSQLIVHS